MRWRSRLVMTSATSSSIDSTPSPIHTGRYEPVKGATVLSTAMPANGSTTEVTMWMPRNTSTSSERLRCTAWVRKRGQSRAVPAHRGEDAEHQDGGEHQQADVAGAARRVPERRGPGGRDHAAGSAVAAVTSRSAGDHGRLGRHIAALNPEPSVGGWAGGCRPVLGSRVGAGGGGAGGLAGADRAAREGAGGHGGARERQHAGARRRRDGDRPHAPLGAVAGGRGRLLHSRQGTRRALRLPDALPVNWLSDTQLSPGRVTIADVQTHRERARPQPHRPGRVHRLRAPLVPRPARRPR